MPRKRMPRDAKAGFPTNGKSSAIRHCRAGPFAARVALRRPWGRSSPTQEGSTTTECDMVPPPPRTSFPVPIHATNSMKRATSSERSAAAKLLDPDLGRAVD